MRHTHLLAVGILAVVAVSIHVARLATREKPAPHTVKHEQEVGEKIGNMVTEGLAADASMTVLYLYNDVKVYQGRTEALRATLAERTPNVHEIWARDEGHYDDFDYSKSLDIALEDNPDAEALLIVSLGTCTHAKVTPALQAFLKKGGKLYLSGSVLKEAPFTQLARKGYATIMAKRDSWLKQQDPPLADTSYADRHYVLLADTHLKNDKS